MRRIMFSVLQNRIRDLRFAIYAVAQDYEGNSEAVARSIERTTGLRWCGGPRCDGLSPDGTVHYYGTLGEPLSSGGYCPKSEVWFFIQKGKGKGKGK